VSGWIVETKRCMLLLEMVVSDQPPSPSIVCATTTLTYARSIPSFSHNNSHTHSIFHVYGSDAPSLSSRVWIELDAIPFVMRSRGHTLDERASTAVRQAVVTCVSSSMRTP
jgi:hypothetical protein